MRAAFPATGNAPRFVDDGDGVGDACDPTPDFPNGVRLSGGGCGSCASFRARDAGRLVDVDVAITGAFVALGAFTLGGRRRRRNRGIPPQ